MHGQPHVRVNVLLSMETRRTTSFLRRFERYGAGVLWVISANFLILCICFPSRWVPPEEATILSRFHFRYFQLRSHVKRHYLSSRERRGTESIYSGWKIVALSIWRLHTPFDKKKSEVLAATNSNEKSSRLIIQVDTESKCGISETLQKGTGDFFFVVSAVV